MGGFNDGFFSVISTCTVGLMSDIFQGESNLKAWSRMAMSGFAQEPVLQPGGQPCVVVNHPHV